MLKTNSANRISPTEQIYYLNRVKGLNETYNLGDGGLDPITAVASGFISSVKKLIGLFTKDPYRDIHIPAQNQAVSNFANIINQVSSKETQGTLSKDDINRAVYSIQTIYTEFQNLCNDLMKQHPQDASRYQAGRDEVVALGKRIVSDMTSRYSSIINSNASLSDIAHSVVSSLTGSGGSILPLVVLAAGVFFVPKLLKR